MPGRVLVIGEFGSLNGGENSLLAIIPTLFEAGWKFAAAAPTPSEFSQALNKAGIKSTPFSTFDEHGQRKSQEEVRQELTTIIRIAAPDLIHCNSLSTSRLVGPIASELRIPSLGYLRDILKLSKKAIADINQLDRLIAVSRATRDWHCQQGIDRTKTFVVHNGVDSDRFRPPTDERNQTLPNNSIRTELGIPKHDQVLLFVGQIGMRKGVHALVEAFLNIVAEEPTTKLLIVGRRNSQKQEAIEYEQHARQLVAESAYPSSVFWLGTRTDVAEIMRTATVLVHPARQEPLGRVLLEAAASGLPIVTTNVGGSAEILLGFESELVNPDANDEIVKSVLQLLRDPNHAQSFGQALRQIAVQSFSIRQCVNQLETHYSDLIY